MGLRPLYLAGAALVASTIARGVFASSSGVVFEDATDAAGVSVVHRIIGDPRDQLQQVAGGAVGGDFDGDGWFDLFVIGGNGDRQYLFRNAGDGSFVDIAADGNVDFSGVPFTGPAAADVDGDRDLDLFLGGVPVLDAPLSKLLLNSGSGVFSESDAMRDRFPRAVYASSAFGDVDGDGFLDLFTAHWTHLLDLLPVDHFWRNDRQGGFAAATDDVGVVIDTRIYEDIGRVSFSFTPNFVDFDADGFLDVLLASDFGYSQIFVNDGSGRLANRPDDVLTDENGMGAAIGDFDNDGDFDWFVTSIFDPNATPLGGWGGSGNRLYRNNGEGGFEDATEETGVRDGSWGWGACAADFNNDGWEDIFHVNGWDSNFTEKWLDQPARLFLNQGDGTFVERAAESGIDDSGNGRAVVCFDYDRDGAIDVFVGNIDGPVRLFRNRSADRGNFAQVALVGCYPNTEGIGAVVTLRAAELFQRRVVRAGSNFLSQDPAVAHFGLGGADSIEELVVEWPSGERTTMRNLSPNRFIEVLESPGDSNCDSRTTAADLVVPSVAAGRDADARVCPVADVDQDGVCDFQDVARVIDGIFASHTACMTP